MSISELLPSALAMADDEKVQLIRILSEDLKTKRPDLLKQVAGEMPVWSPLGAFSAAETLLAALEADEMPVSTHA